MTRNYCSCLSGFADDNKSTTDPPQPMIREEVLNAFLANGDGFAFFTCACLPSLSARWAWVVEADD